MSTKINWVVFLATAGAAAGVGWFWSAQQTPTESANDAVLEEPVASRPIQTEVPAPGELGPVDDSETEIVMGLEVKKDRNCTVVQSYLDVGNGTVIPAYSCKPDTELPVDPYQDYDEETLVGMSYHDAEAAAELGRRLFERDLERARALMIRSVALEPSNTDPLNWLASVAYSQSATNGEPTFGPLSNNYVLARVADEIAGSEHAALLLLQLERAGFSSTDIEQLEHLVSDDLNRIREIQIEVTGDSEIPEVAL